MGKTNEEKAERLVVLLNEKILPMKGRVLRPRRPSSFQSGDEFYEWTVNEWIPKQPRMTGPALISKGRR